MLIRLSDYMIPVKSLSKPHKGVVVDNEDPTKLGRVKCTIDGIYEAEKEKLPWILNPSDPNGLDVPEVGDELIIVFPFNDIYSPEIGGYYHSEKNHNTAFDTDYPKTFGISKGGLDLLHNKETDQSDITHPSGSTLKVTDAGTMEISLTEDLKLTIAGKYEITSTGDIKFASDAKFTLTAASGIDMSTDGSAKLIGKGSTTVGSSSSTTKVDGTVLLLAGGGLPVALVTSQCVGIGNLGGPVVSTVLDGSSKVLAPK